MEDCCFRDLCGGLAQPCPCVNRCQWKVEKVDRFGHAAGVTFVCSNCTEKRRLLSSRILGGKYVVNQR